tara:strand:+ start:940 stop:1098 length:159 start_codon:yes stop_codon:yes gene_type:complete
MTVISAKAATTTAFETKAERRARIQAGNAARAGQATAGKKGSATAAPAPAAR